MVNRVDILQSQCRRIDWRFTKVVISIGWSDIEPWTAIHAHRPDVNVIIFEPNEAVAKELVYDVAPGWFCSKQSGAENFSFGVKGVSVCSHLVELRKLCDQGIRFDDRVEIVGDPNLLPRWVSLVQTTINTSVQATINAQGTMRDNALMWVHKGLDALPIIANSVTLDRIGPIFRGELGIVVGAGPSLEAALPALKRLQGKAVIIATGSAVGPLEVLGIQPDIITVVEAKTHSTVRPEDGVDITDTEAWRNAIIIPGIHANEHVWQSECRALLPSLQSVGPVGQWLCKLFGVSGLATGGSVSTMAYRIAEHLGCSPIALVGCDCAQGTDGNSAYCEGVQHKEAATVRQFGAPLTTLQRWGGIGHVMATPALEHYHHWFCERAHEFHASTGSVVLNCSEGGARIDGAVEERLGHVADKAPDETSDFRGHLESAIAMTVPLDCVVIAKSIREHLEASDSLATRSAATAEKVKELGNELQELYQETVTASILAGAAVGPIEEYNLLPQKKGLYAMYNFLNRIDATWSELRPKLAALLVTLEERYVRAA